MKRRLALKICTISLVVGLCLGPAITHAVNRLRYETQLSTVNGKDNKPKPTKPRIDPKPPPIPEKTPDFPTNITLRIRVKFTTSVPKFVLWSEREGQFKSTVLNDVKKDLDDHVAVLTRGMDPAKQYWIRVDDGPRSGETMLQHPAVSGQELPLEVRLHPIVTAKITIEDYADFKPSTLSVGRMGSTAQLLIPYPVNDNGIAIFTKGMDPDLQHEIYVKGFAPIRIESEDLRRGDLEKRIKLGPSVETAGLGGKLEPPDDKNQGNSWWPMDVIIGVIIIAFLVGVFLFGARRLYDLGTEPSVSQVVVRTSHTAPRQPRRVNSRSHSPTPMREPGVFIEREFDGNNTGQMEDSSLNQPTEPQTYDVPSQLSGEDALQAYKSLIQNGSLSRQPLTVDIMLSDSPDKKGEQLKETMDPSSKFILFTSGHEQGWLFPNPAQSVRETNVEQTWQLLFEGLSRDEFERKMDRLRPIEVIRNNKGGRSLWNAIRQKCRFD
jgi:hypothetical protein